MVTLASARLEGPMPKEHKLQHIHVAEFEPQLLQIFNRNCPGQYRAFTAFGLPGL